MKQFFFIVITIIFSFLNIQAKTNLKNENSNCIDKNLLIKNDLDSLTGLLFDSSETKSFYFFGESHNFLANSDLLLSVVFKLHQKGVYNIINEFPHATCFLMNEYLASGDTAILNELQPKATYKALRIIREFNLTQPDEKKIKFYGIDFYTQSDAKNLVTELKMLMTRHKIENNDPLNLIFQNCLKDSSLINKGEGDFLITFNTSIDSLLNGSKSEEYKKILGDDYKELQLMAKNEVSMKKRSDKVTYNNFLNMYAIFFKNKPSLNPKFLAFYGSNHISQFGRLLSESKESPVKDKVKFVALAYINCWGDWDYNPTKILSNGYPKTFNNQDWNYIVNTLDTTNNLQKVGLFINNNCVKLHKNADLLNTFIIFKNYGDRRMHSWKFD